METANWRQLIEQVIVKNFCERFYNRFLNIKIAFHRGTYYYFFSSCLNVNLFQIHLQIGIFQSMLSALSTKKLFSLTKEIFKTSRTFLYPLCVTIFKGYWVSPYSQKYKIWETRFKYRSIVFVIHKRQKLMLFQSSTLIISWRSKRT